jgi:hypothetical protein
MADEEEEGAKLRLPRWRDQDYWSARREHAWLLRAGGLTLQAIGVRLGVTRERVRQMVARFAIGSGARPHGALRVAADYERLARLAEERFGIPEAKG